MWAELKNRLVQKLQGEGSQAVVARGAIGAFVARAAGAGLPFLLHIILIRVLGTESYGRYVYVIGWVNLLAALARLGFGRAAVRHGAIYWQRQDWSHFRGLQRAILGIAAMASLVIGLGLAAFLLLRRTHIHPELHAAFWWAIPAVLATAINFLLRNFARAQQRPALAVAAEFIFVRVTLIPLVLGAYALIGTLAAPRVVALHALALGLASTHLAYVVRRGSPLLHRKVKPTYDLHHWKRGTPSFFLTTVFNLVRTQSDVVLVGALLTPTEVGLYSIAKRVSELVTWAAVALNSSVGPMIARLHATQRTLELRTLIRNSTISVAAISAGLATALALVGRWVLMLFGDHVTSAFGPLLVLLVGHLATATSGPARQVLIMTEREREALLVSLLSAASFIGCILLLTPTFALYGAVASSCLVSTASSLLVLLRVRAHLATP